MISYTTTALVFAMGDVQTASVAETTLMNAVVIAVSRQLDTWLSQVFAEQIYAAQVMRAQIDPDGVLQCWPACPVMSAPTALAWKRASDVAWNNISGASVEVAESNSGCQVRVLNPNLGIYRGSRLQMRLSFTGGWAALGDVPSDFEYGCRRLCWMEYKKRDQAEMGKTAIPELGVVITPGAWPADVKRVFESYRRVVLI